MIQCHRIRHYMVAKEVSCWRCEYINVYNDTVCWGLGPSLHGSEGSVLLALRRQQDTSFATMQWRLLWHCIIPYPQSPTHCIVVYVYRNASKTLPSLPCNGGSYDIVSFLIPNPKHTVSLYTFIYQESSWSGRSGLSFRKYPETFEPI